MITFKNSYKYIFFILLSLVVVSLFYTANNLSISYKEALNYFVNSSLLTILTHSFTYIFGQNDIALRMPFLIFYFLSIFLMYLITEDFFKKEFHRYVTLGIFMLLPGLLSASLLVNSAIVVTFFTLLYIYYYQKYHRHCYTLLVLFLFIDNSFAILFLALFLFSLKQKNKILSVVSLSLFIISMWIYGFDMGGKPRGFLVDTFAIYSSIFSPLLFMYFVYSIYRSGIKNNRSLIWYISSTSLIFSLLLSFRQRIYIEDYAPFVVIFLPYMIKIFFHTLSVRLPQFRYRHKNIAIITLVVLGINSSLTLFNKPIYLVLENPKKHFAYDYNFAKEIALTLKQNNINEVYSDDKELLLRLKFYGINQGNKFLISTYKQRSCDFEVPIKYLGKTLITLYIIKVA